MPRINGRNSQNEMSTEIAQTLARRARAFGWIAIPPGTSFDAPVFRAPRFAFPTWIDLTTPYWQGSLIHSIRSSPTAGVSLLSPHLRSSPEILVDSLKFFLPRVHESWKQVGCFGLAPVRESPKRLVGIATEELLNLAFALWCCRTHPDIDRLFRKLQSDHLRGGLLEVQIATNLIRAGYSVRVEPNLSLNGRSSDIRLDLENTTLFIECKRPRIVLQTHHTRCQVIQTAIHEKLKPLPAWFDPSRERIDVLLKTRLEIGRLDELVTALGQLETSGFGNVVDSPRYALCRRGIDSETPFRNRTFMTTATVEGPGRPVQALAGPICVYLDSSQGLEPLIGRLINDANRQLKSEIERHGGVGVIVVEYPRPQFVMTAADLRIRLPEYNQVEAIVGLAGEHSQIVSRLEFFPTAVAAQMAQPIGC